MERNPFAPPAAVVEDTLSPEKASTPLARRFTRLLAAMVDTLSYVLLGSAPILFSRYGFATEIVALVCSVVIVVISITNLIWLYRYGQSLGKRLLSIKITRTSGERCAFGRLLALRTLLPGFLAVIPLVGWFIYLADLLFVFRQDRRCLHDLLADTVVVEA